MQQFVERAAALLDGTLDVVPLRDAATVALLRDGPDGLEVYLQTPEGLFYREQGSELDAVGQAFDIQLIDLNGDGRDDIVAGCAPEGEKSGGVYVWLSKPAV